MPLLWMAFAACVPKTVPTPAPGAETRPAVEAPAPPEGFSPKVALRGALDERFYGEWAVAGSSARWSMLREGGATFLLGLDSQDGERFEVQGFVAEGATVRFTSRMPSTGHTIDQEWTLDAAGRCTCTVRGDAEVTVACTRLD